MNRGHDRLGYTTLTLAVERTQIVINLSLSRATTNELKIRSFAHHLQVADDRTLLALVTLPRTVDPDTLESNKNGSELKIVIQLDEEGGHPKPIPPAAEDESCCCVEHPRSKISDDGERKSQE